MLYQTIMLSYTASVDLRLTDATQLSARDIISNILNITVDTLVFILFEKNLMIQLSVRIWVSMFIHIAALCKRSEYVHH